MGAPRIYNPASSVSAHYQKEVPYADTKTMFLRKDLKVHRCLACKKRKKKCQTQQDSNTCQFCARKGIECKFEDFEVSHHINGKVVKPGVFKKQQEAKDHRGIILKKGTDLPKETSFVNLSEGGVEVIHIPVHYLDHSCGVTTIHEEVEQVDIMNSDTILDESFSLFDYILSGSRIKVLDSENENVDIKEDRLRIATSNFTARRNFAIETLKSHKNLTTTKVFPKKLLHVISESLDDIELDIDIPNLKNVVRIPEAAISSDGKKLVNLPDFITKELADMLFDHFCDVSRKKKSLWSTSKVSFLKVCLPLVFGSHTVLKCVLLLSYYHLSKYGNNPKIEQYQQKMHSLHLRVLHELKDRLAYYISVSCDHSIFIVFLLLSIEILNGGRTTLWTKLSRIVQKMVALRGGISKMCQSLTGVCVIRLISVQICTDIHLEDNNDPISLSEFLKLFSIADEVDFFDNFNYKYSLSFKELSPTIKLYGQATIIHRLMLLSCGSVSLDNTFDYKSINSVNMRQVLNESANLEMEIKESSEIQPLNTIPLYHKTQLSFAIHTSELYLYQIVYKQVSICPKTVLLVQQLLTEVETIFKILNSSTEELNDVCILSLPLFCLGVDLVSPTVKEWYIEQLSQLFENFKRNMIQTIIFLLQKVWELNKDGSACVDWRSLSEVYSSFVSLAC